MNLIDPLLEKYVLAHTDPEPQHLQELDRETHLKVLMPRMLSGHYQGRLLSMLSKLVQPDCILEIGTYTGYSAICLAEGLSKTGILHTIDINDELEAFARSWFKKAGVSEKILYHSGNALKIIPAMNLQFDLVFIDADKENYGNYYDLVIDKVRKGGLIIADNVLWSGKVLEDPMKTDKDTRAIQAFNDRVQKDSRVENILLPVRDGLLILRKK